MALAIFLVKDGIPLEDADKEIITNPVASDKLGELNKDELLEVKKEITDALI